MKELKLSIKKMKSNKTSPWYSHPINEIITRKNTSINVKVSESV